jgi:hypothetical protein
MDQENKPLRSKVSIQDIYDKIKATQYIALSDGRTTLCVANTENGFTVVGKSACVDKNSYNQALGEKYAFEDVVEQMWELEGYLLKQEHYIALGEGV